MSKESRRDKAAAEKVREARLAEKKLLKAERRAEEAVAVAQVAVDKAQSKFDAARAKLDERLALLDAAKAELQRHQSARAGGPQVSEDDAPADADESPEESEG